MNLIWKSVMVDYTWIYISEYMWRTANSCFFSPCFLCFASSKSQYLSSILMMTDVFLNGESFRLLSTWLRLQRLLKTWGFTAYSWAFVFVRQDIGRKTLDIFRHFPWQRWWVRRPSVSGAGQKECGSGPTQGERWTLQQGSDPGGTVETGQVGGV